MELVKKNIVSIICGGIAILALVALVWPISGWYEGLDTRLKERKKANDEIAALVKQERKKPATGLSDQPESLPRFPNQAVIDEGNKAMAMVHQQARAALAYVVGLNRRDHNPLVPGSLPKPVSAREQYAFREDYRLAMGLDQGAARGTATGSGFGGNPAAAPPATRPAAAAAAAAANPQNIPDGILGAVAPPTKPEIDAALVKLWQEKYEQQIIKIERPGAAGQPPVVQEPNRPQIVAQFQKDTANFADEFRQRRATQYKVYMDPDARTVDPAMGPTATPSADQIWYAQMNLWVQQDIARAIRDMNASKGPDGREVTGIQNSRVKHLMAIDVPLGIGMYVTPGGLTPGGPPMAATAAPGAAGAPAVEIPPKVFTRSVTGRVSNPMYDVIHSTVTVVVAEQNVRDFMQMLESGRLITVLEIDQTRVDTAAAKEQGYDYGSGPVVRVTLQLEHLFLRDWTAYAPDAPMPPEVKTALGVQQPPADPAAPGALPVTASR